MNVEELLTEHHRQTEAACSELLAKTYTDDPRELVAHFRVFEHELREHLAVEEELMLPEYAFHSPANAHVLRDDHAEIRATLDRLGLEVELHCVRAATVTAFVTMLRAHAAYEDATLYPWAQKHLPLHERRRLVARIAHSLQLLARIQRRAA